MILKLKTFNEALGEGWKYIDNIERVNTYTIPDKSVFPNQTGVRVVIRNIDGAQDASKGDIAFNCKYFDVLKVNGMEDSIYTELPAYLCNDEGKTIERLN